MLSLAHSVASDILVDFFFFFCMDIYKGSVVLASIARLIFYFVFFLQNQDMSKYESALIAVACRSMSVCS